MQDAATTPPNPGDPGAGPTLAQGCWLAAFTLVIAAGFWLVLPGIVVVFNDDFGYLRSIVATIQRGRPWTDDWLEPWAASLSLLAAAVFRVTGSFQAATQGLQTVLVAGSFCATCVLLVRRSFPLGWAAAAAAVGLTFPTVLFKSVEFGGVVLCLPCLLAAVLFFERKRWGLFFAVWLLAVTTRQSAVAWLALPAMAGMAAWRARSREGLGPALGAWAALFAGMAAYFATSRLMNETYAQKVMTGAMWQNLRIASAVRNFALAGAVFAVGVGLGALLTRALPPRRPSGEAAGSRWFLGVRVAAALSIALFFALDPRKLMEFEHSLLAGRPGSVYLGLGLGLAATGWLLGGFRVRPDLAAAAFAAAMLVSVRQVVWDYYLLDVGVLGFLCAAPAGTPPPSASPAMRRNVVTWCLGGVALAGLAWFHAGFVVRLKQTLDGDAAAVSLCERALRAGRIGPSEIGVAPFGYHGWKLFPYFIRHDGAAGAYIADFEGYLAKRALTLEIGTVAASAPRAGRVEIPAGSTAAAVARGVFAWGWGRRALFVLERRATAKGPRMAIDRASYDPDEFPLDDTEWRALVERPRREASHL